MSNQSDDKTGPLHADSLASLPLGDLDHASGDDGSSERSSEEVDTLVDSVTLNGSYRDSR
jgi:hypothetical protein